MGPSPPARKKTCHNRKHKKRRRRKTRRKNMPIKIITPPDSIHLDFELSSGGKKQQIKRTISFPEFVRENLMSLPHWGHSYATINSASAIEKALVAFETEKTAEGEVSTIELAEEDWKRLTSTLEEPPQGLGLIPQAGVQLLPFMAAILEAKTK